MYFCTEFTKFDNFVLTGKVFGVYDSTDDVSFDKCFYNFSADIDFNSKSFIVGSYAVSMYKITLDFIKTAIKSEAYLILDCEYVEDIY